MAGRTTVEVACCIIGELVLGEAPRGDGRTALWPRDVGNDTNLLTSSDVLAFVIAFISYGIDPLDAEQLPRVASCLRQQAEIATGIADMLLDDQLVLRIHGHLRVVAHADLGAGRHSARIGVGKRNLAFAPPDR